MKRLLTALAAAALLAACSSGSETTPEQYRDLAEDVCKSAVEDTLKDPGSAEFSSVSTVMVIDGERWKVTGQVNANNSFGGKVGDQGFTCTANYTEDDDTMRGSASLERG